MNSDTFDEVIKKLTELRLKERYNKKDNKYILTKEELILFCIELIKVIEQNSNYSDINDDLVECDECHKVYPSTYITRFPNETICHQCIDDGYGD